MCMLYVCVLSNCWLLSTEWAWLFREMDQFFHMLQFIKFHKTISAIIYVVWSHSLKQIFKDAYNLIKFLYCWSP